MITHIQDVEAARSPNTRVSVIRDECNRFVCPATNCGRTFSLAIGLTNHVAWFHKNVEENDRNRETSIPCKLNVATSRVSSDELNKSFQFYKWSVEELNFLARCEYELQGSKGKARLMYNMMVNLGYQRTYKAVEAVLRRKNYTNVRDRLFTKWDDEVLAAQTEPVVIDLPSEEGPISLGLGPEGGLQEPGVAPASYNQKIEKILTLLTLIGGDRPSKKYSEWCLDEIIVKLGKHESVDEQLEYFFKMLTNVGGIKNADKRGKPKGPKGKPVNKRHVKKLIYKRFREKWKRDRSRVASEILGGVTNGEMRPEKIDGFRQHWEETFKKPPDGACDVSGMKILNDKYDMWIPVQLDELVKTLKDMKKGTSDGPDKLPLKVLKAMPIRVLWKLVNIIMVLGRVPSCLKRSRTVFIPKKSKCREPKDFRPISVTSVFLRLFNKMLAKRIVNLAKFDYRQKAFLPIDGCAENIVLLEALIKEAKSKCSSLFIANLDMKNAYGSVFHPAIYEALRCNGAPTELIEYVKDLYSDFATVLEIRDDSQDNVLVPVRRGVLQGDPLSPILFNMVMDQLMRKIPDEVGFPLAENIRVNGMAFADDTTITTQTAAGMQRSLDIVSTNGKVWGLEFNSDKCNYLAIVGKGGKRTVVSTKIGFRVNGRNIRGLNALEPWRYLGAYFTGCGLHSAPELLQEWLQRVKKASLKPQEKLYVIRVHLIPKLIHALSMGTLLRKDLSAMDKMIRHSLRGKSGMLHLPKTIPVAFFYAPVKDGGLGLMRLRHSIPSIVLHRFGRLLESGCRIVRCAGRKPANQMRLSKAASMLVNHDGVLGDTPERIAYVNKMYLYDHVDGVGLKWCGEVPYAHEWISKGSIAAMSGYNFVDALKLRINALPTRAYFALRYPGKVVQCRAGCGVPETVAHIMQSCMRNKGAMIRRHDGVVDIINRALIKLGYETFVEQVFHTSIGTRKPDIVAVKDGRIYVIDPTVCGEKVHPDVRHVQKTEKYESIPEISEALLKRYPGHVIEFGGLACTFRGVWSGMSEQLLRDLGISKRVIQRVTEWVIRGSVILFRNFRKSDTMVNKIVL